MDDLLREYLPIIIFLGLAIALGLAFGTAQWSKRRIGAGQQATGPRGNKYPSDQRRRRRGAAKTAGHR